MKEVIKIGSVIFGIVLVIIIILYFIVWIFTDPLNIVPDKKIETSKAYTYEWSQCFNVDRVSQEYADKIASEVEQNHPGGYWKIRGKQDVIGCFRNSFYYYVIE